MDGRGREWRRSPSYLPCRPRDIGTRLCGRLGERYAVTARSNDRLRAPLAAGHRAGRIDNRARVTVRKEQTMPGLTERQIAQFTDAGYLVLEDVLDPRADLDPVVEEYTVIMHRLARDLFAAGRISSTCSDLPFAKRLTSDPVRDRRELPPALRYRPAQTACRGTDADFGRSGGFQSAPQRDAARPRRVAHRARDLCQPHSTCPAAAAGRQRARRSSG